MGLATLGRSLISLSTSICLGAHEQKNEEKRKRKLPRGSQSSKNKYKREILIAVILNLRPGRILQGY